MTLKVFWASGSPMAWPVQLALQEKALPHESVQLSFANGDNRSADFLALNPRGKVPVLVHNDITVYESHACVEYLEAAFPEPALRPASASARALDLVRRFETSYIYPAADAAISYTSYSSTLTREEWDADHLAALAVPLVEEFSRWDDYLADCEWLCGDPAPTLADLFLIPFVMYMHRFGFDYGARGMSNLAAYHGRARNRPSVQATWPPHWRESEGDPTFAPAAALA